MRLRRISALRRNVLMLLSILALSGCNGVTMSDSEADALYQARFAHYRAGDLTALYDIMEPVAGAIKDLPLPLAPPENLNIAATALSDARVYAQNNRSSALLVWRDGALQEQDYFGAANRTTPLAALSLAKPLATIAIGRAIALGLITSLDQPVADFITEWRGGAKAEMRIGQLLTMRSGLQAQDFVMDPASVMNRAYLSPFHDRVLIDDYPLTDPPGIKLAYSNATADLVAIIIERATRRRYARFLSEEILQPIGALGGSIWLDRPHGLAHSGCCILLPAETWLRLGILLIRDGMWDGKHLLDHDFVAAMMTAQPDYPYGGTMGLYLAGPYRARRGFSGPSQTSPQVLHSEPYLAADLVLFDGNADQVLYIVPSADLVALRMGSPPPKQPEWDNSVIPNVLLRGINWHGNPPPSPQLR